MDDRAIESSQKSPDQKKSDRGLQFVGLPLDPTTVLFVSLFLALFSFFAALNIHSSEHSESSAKVMASLSESFGGKPVASDQRQETAKGDSTGLQLRDLVEAGFGDSAIGISNADDRFEAQFSVADFFVSKTTRIAPTRELFLKDVASLMENLDTDEYRISLVFSGLEDDLAGQRRASAMAATYAKYNTLPERLEIVGANGKKGEVILIVRWGAM